MPQITRKYDSDSLIVTILEDIISKIDIEFAYIELDSLGSSDAVYIRCSENGFYWPYVNGVFRMFNNVICYPNANYGYYDGVTISARFDLLYPDNTVKLSEFISKLLRETHNTYKLNPRALRRYAKHG